MYLILHVAVGVTLMLCIVLTGLNLALSIYTCTYFIKITAGTRRYGFGECVFPLIGW